MANLIQIDKQCIEYCSINTDEFLERALGKPLNLQDEAWERITPGNYGRGEDRFIKCCVETQEDKDYLMSDWTNTYNGESDLSQVVQYVVLYPAESRESDWYFADDGCYVIVEPHLGGDVRGNYGMLRLYKLNGSPADCGLFDTMIGWRLYDDDNEDVGEDEFDCGFHSNPTYEMQKEIPDLAWDEDREGFVGTYEGKRVCARPYHQLGNDYE
jgi:hypothetical protein